MFKTIFFFIYVILLSNNLWAQGLELAGDMLEGEPAPEFLLLKHDFIDKTQLLHSSKSDGAIELKFDIEGVVGLEAFLAEMMDSKVTSVQLVCAVETQIINDETGYAYIRVIRVDMCVDRKGVPRYMRDELGNDVGETYEKLVGENMEIIPLRGCYDSEF